MSTVDFTVGLGDLWSKTDWWNDLGQEETKVSDHYLQSILTEI